MAPSFPHHTTFAPGELARLEATLRKPSDNGAAETTVGQDALAAASLPAHSGSRLLKVLKEYTCTVTYPDGSAGTCHYERKGPAAHRFQFVAGVAVVAGENSEATAATLPKTILATPWWTRPLGNHPADIEQKAAELTPAAFAEAIERERKEYFARASEGAGRRKHPECFQMSAERAKQLAGRYALCTPVGKRLLPLTETFANLETANEAWRELWREKGDTGLVVACCNRLDRCWERPRYNTLYKEFPAMAHASESSASGG